MSQPNKVTRSGEKLDTELLDAGVFLAASMEDAGVVCHFPAQEAVRVVIPLGACVVTKRPVVVRRGLEKRAASQAVQRLQVHCHGNDHIRRCQ